MCLCVCVSVFAFQQMAPKMEAATNKVANLLFKPNYIELTRKAHAESLGDTEDDSKLKRKKTRKKTRKGKKARALVRLFY